MGRTQSPAPVHRNEDSVGRLTPEIGLDAFLGSFARTAYATGILTAWQGQAATGSPDGYHRPRS